MVLLRARRARVCAHLSDSHVRQEIEMPEMARDRIAMLMRRPLELAWRSRKRAWRD